MLEHLWQAEVYEDWEEAALRLDNLLALDLWRDSRVSRHYDHNLIADRLTLLSRARRDRDWTRVASLLSSGLVRNLGNVASPRLYNHSFAGTKYLIEEYVTQMAEAVRDIAGMPTPRIGPNGTTAAASAASASTTRQMKLDFIHDSRHAFGRSTLVLQGGAIFGLCHLGVVKALFLRGLLPRIITGTATGALIAALVAIHTDEELPDVLKGDGIDLSAFDARGVSATAGPKGRQTFWTRWETLVRRIQRFTREGYFLDVRVLEECVRANVGDLTFEEAFNRSKRVLNITVATAENAGVPTLLNYLTAPNVVSSRYTVNKHGNLPLRLLTTNT